MRDLMGKGFIRFFFALLVAFSLGSEISYAKQSHEFSCKSVVEYLDKTRTVGFVFSFLPKRFRPDFISYDDELRSIFEQLSEMPKVDGPYYAMGAARIIPSEMLFLILREKMSELGRDFPFSVMIDMQARYNDPAIGPVDYFEPPLAKLKPQAKSDPMPWPSGNGEVQAFVLRNRDAASVVNALKNRPHFIPEEMRPKDVKNFRDVGSKQRTARDDFLSVLLGTGRESRTILYIRGRWKREALPLGSLP